MSRRRTLTTIGLVIAAIFLVLFIVVGIPFIQSTFSTPIPGLPTTDASSSPASLKDRYTQTAAAKQSGGRATIAPTTAP